jgi:Kef-type K+ transport system membrane component KefB
LQDRYPGVKYDIGARLLRNFLFMKNVIKAGFFVFIFLLIPQYIFASGGGDSHGEIAKIFLLFAVVLFVAKLGGIVEKFGQPAVLGELLTGIILSFLAFTGWQIARDIQTNSIILFMAELGAILLLFQIGLESNISKIVQVGGRALLVAITGVVVPFVLGAFVVSPLVFGDAELISHLFVGASFVATSVGVTSAVFKSFNAHKSRASSVVLGAAVIDDILGLIVLAVVFAMASGSKIDVGYVTLITVKSFGFLLLAVLLGNHFARALSKFFSMISTGTGMKMAMAIVFALMYSYIASLMGLAPIIGAFAAGLVLDAVHFKFFSASFATVKLKEIQKHSPSASSAVEEFVKESEHTHVERMVSSVGLIFVPIFFALTGARIEFASLLDGGVYLTAGILTFVAILGKVVSGIFAEGDWREKLLVGVAMVPRGEVGLIFATSGKALGVISDSMFSAIILVIVLTTFVAPPLIAQLLKNQVR